MSHQATLFETIGADRGAETGDRPREDFLTGMLATWLALDRAGEGAKPTKAERDAAKLAAREALDALRRPTAPEGDPG